jgi:4-hydroxyphenylpyruvate dioxygenase-like putative hemolysin
MAKSEAKQPKPSKRAATKAFERAWKLLGRLEMDVAEARAEEAKRRQQLLEASGDQLVRRQAQLDAAIWRGAEGAALLTELSELIAANARAKAGQTVRNIAHEAAEAIRAEERAKSAALVDHPAKPIVKRAKPPVSSPRGTRTPAARTPSARTSAARRATTPARPRPRRSLQPGDGGSGESDT